MARVYNGWFRIERKLLKGDIAQKSHETLIVWLNLLAMANTSESSVYLPGMKKKIQRGQMVTAIDELARELKISESKVRTAIKYLKMTGRITDEPNTKGRVISIVKWDQYQYDHGQDDGQMTDRSLSDHFQMTDRSPSDDFQITPSEQLTINNGTKKQENNEQDSLPATAVLDAGQLKMDQSSEPEKKPKRKELTAEQKDLNKRIWQSYEDAYIRRHKVKPARNLTVNGQISQLRNRLGEEAVDVIAYYVMHNDGFYVKKLHPVGLCLADAEALRTQWLRGIQVTSQKVRNFEKMSGQVELMQDAEKGGF